MLKKLSKVAGGTAVAVALVLGFMPGSSSAVNYTWFNGGTWACSTPGYPAHAQTILSASNAVYHNHQENSGSVYRYFSLPDGYFKSVWPTDASHRMAFLNTQHWGNTSGRTETADGSVYCRA